MRIGDKLLAKTAGVVVKPGAGAENASPKTSPGRMLAAQSAVAAAEKRVAELEANAGKAVEVPLAQITEVPGRRRRLTPEQYEELKENLRNNSLVSPITLVVRGDGAKEIVAGHNRFHIYRELGRETIPAVFAQLEDVEQIEAAAFYSNLLSPSLPDFEKFLGFQKHIDRTGQSQQEVAAAAGISAGHLSKLFAYSRLPKAALEALANADDRSRLGVNAAHEMAGFLSEYPGNEEAVTEIVSRLMTDPRLTQKQALGLLFARVRDKKPAKTTAVAIRSGGKDLCTLSANGGVLTLKFKDPTVAKEWEERVKNFLESSS
ncbi:ParB/RepB/Spo0J family partition protein [Cupriavidus plantarum]|uniref:ParB/RepB/Spo0J family partition protein n=1 Tax=Cupriavidus plantarum TaxID=942865 RepID=UPI0015C84190|nr:ParB N-terminal domain-containing protein [Cupriavidus plantarum]NYI02790.1 ParB family chromosome partitioning protein [Cupriavidus plantarum]